MPSFDPRRSQTNDVVRQAIIPSSRVGDRGRALAEIWEERPVLPQLGRRMACSFPYYLCCKSARNGWLAFLGASDGQYLSHAKQIFDSTFDPRSKIPGGELFFSVFSGPPATSNFDAQAEHGHAPLEEPIRPFAGSDLGRFMAPKRSDGPKTHEAQSATGQLFSGKHHIASL